MQRIPEVDLPRPEATPSGLFRIVPVEPEPPARGALKLRRAVGLTVLIGTLGLLAYASWQRVAHARSSEWVATPSGPGSRGVP